MLCSNTSSFWDYISKQLEHHPPSLRRSHIDVQVDMWIVGVVLPVAHGDQLACRALVRNARITQRENGKSNTNAKHAKEVCNITSFSPHPSPTSSHFSAIPVCRIYSYLLALRREKRNEEEKREQWEDGQMWRKERKGFTLDVNVFRCVYAGERLKGMRKGQQCFGRSPAKLKNIINW
jgi:hypothetical protein